LPGPGEQRPREKSANPGRCRQRQPFRNPAEHPDKNDLGVGRFKKKIATAPVRIPKMLETAKIMGLVIVRRRIASDREKHKYDE
jgi:hypothetical protein